MVKKIYKSDDQEIELVSDLVSDMIENLDYDFDSDYELEQELFNSSVFMKSKTEDNNLAQQFKIATSKAINIAKSSIENSDSTDKEEKLERKDKKMDKNSNMPNYLAYLAYKELRKKEKGMFDLIMKIAAIILIITFSLIIILSFYYDPVKKYRFHKSIENKLCNNSVFVRKHFNEQDSCCQHMYNSVCDKSYIVDPNIATKCDKYDSFKPFLQFCIYKIGLDDYYDLIEQMFYP